MRGLVRASLLAGVGFFAAMAVAAGPVSAQTGSSAAPPPTTPPPTSATIPSPPPSSSATIVITGSRIKRTNYNSPSPITQITADQAQLQGASDTSQILQLSSVANNATQINNFFTGFITTGGPGVDTLSLRGLGAQRTLILIDGQRIGPAGVGGTVGPIDLNTIPLPIVDHIDILNDGASSIYGSDAIAGVVNIITKKNVDGAELDFRGTPSQDGGGGEFDLNGGIGKTFDRGYLDASFDLYQKAALLYSQRSYFSCSRDIATFQGGGSADVIDPSTGRKKCWNQEGPDVIDYGAPTANEPVFYGYNPAAVGGGGVAGLDIPGWQAVGLYGPPYGPSAVTLTTAQIRASNALFPYAPADYQKQDAVSPVVRYTVNLAGGFDLTPHAKVYGTLLLNERDSQQTFAQQLFGFVNPANVNNPGFGFPLPVVDYLATETQKVFYGRGVLGVQSDLPSMAWFNNWTYDLYGQVSRSDGTYTQTYVPNDRANAVFGAGTSAVPGCDPNAVMPFGGGTTLAQQEPNVSCVPFNLFADVQNGGLNPAEYHFLIQQATGHTTYDQDYIEGSSSGDLFNLPAGPLGASVGFQVRREAINDTPAADFINGNVYNLTTSGITKGSDESQEVFGELNVPVVKGLPLVDSFEFNLSGRLSHYSNYGSNGTYKLGLDWKVTDWLAFRASHGTAFRAPALYEQFLANQSSFLGQMSIDPCIDYATNNALPQIVKTNCASQGIPGNYTGQGSSAEIFTGGGPGLKPETSVAETVGIVFTPKWFNLDLKIAATYYTFDITNQIQNFGAGNIIFQCYEATNFPNSAFCSLFHRDLTPGSPTLDQILTVNDDYVNVARQRDQGLDVDINYVNSHLPKDIKLTIDTHLAWTFYTATSLINGSVQNYLGQVGQPAFNGNTAFTLERGSWTVNYYIYFVGVSSDNQFSSDLNTNYLNTGQTVFLNHVAPFYSNSDLSVRRKFDKFTMTIGIKNLYDTPPPYYSAQGFQSRIGVVPLTSQYDWIGRAFFIDLDKKF